ncbi:hypothetical protein Salat_0189800 [Sesamum alatum]|uniref:Uncharacterized protein n=1 Tax=Sesamum alatum TaxID=300844 RepID=A0AAE1YZD5_9LAMI|nr:hypothetical protein Salat_0189800 [Sesamum alatum]
MQVWLNSNGEQLQNPSQRVAEMVGEKCVPDCAISDQSSALRTYAGQDSGELFKAILYDPGQALLSKHSHTKACAFGHNLSLKCSVFREDKKVLAAESATLKSEIKALKA